jgi:hypothetical protein
MGGPGSGAKSREYPTHIVEEACWLYVAGYTVPEVQARIGRGYKVQNILTRHLLRLRVAAKRDQRGERNDMWKGDTAKYQALHLRVQSARGKADHCELCDDGTKFEWANVSGDYADVNDYMPLCISCHRYLDAARRRYLGANTKGGDANV